MSGEKARNCSFDVLKQIRAPIEEILAQMGGSYLLSPPRKIFPMIVRGRRKRRVVGSNGK